MDDEEFAKIVYVLQRDLEYQKEVTANLKNELREMKALVNANSQSIRTADVWRRALMYCAIAVGAMLTKAETIGAWLRKYIV